MALLSTSLMVGATKATADEQAEIRVYNDFNLPLEPATLITMSEYNLSLCLFVTLFDLDDASTPKSDVLKSWKFDSAKKVYQFEIRDDAVWSDGKPFTADDIIISILRLSKVAPLHYTSISSLFTDPSHDSISSHPDLERVSDKILRVHVNGPTSELPTRLTTSFVPMVRQDLLDFKTLKIARHDVTFAPYVVDAKRSTVEHLVLRKNQNFFHKRDTAANVIEMRPYNGLSPKAEDIGHKDFWANLVMDRAFTTKEGWEQIKARHLAVWTRPVDRILYMYPTKAGMQREDLAAVTRWLGDKISTQPLTFAEFPGTIPAYSLQPNGFFLHKDIAFDAGTAPKANKKYKIALVGSPNPVNYILKEFKDHGLDAEVESFPISKAKSIQASQEFDFIIGAFGAADPDPVTWLSLVLGKDFSFIADYNNEYRNKFTEIKKDTDKDRRYGALRELLYDAGKRGLYLPLAHFSSIAVGDTTLDLSKIREVDETVDLSKVIVKR